MTTMIGKRSLLLSIAAFFAVAVSCVLLLILSALISPEAISSSILRDYDRIEARGDYPLFILESPKYRYDGFTDSLMLLQSIPDRNLSAFENAVLGPYYALGIDTPEGSGTGGISPTMALLEKVSDPSVENNRTYVLYWHGYTVPLRILLTFMSPMSIIVLNCIVFALLVALVFEAFRRTGGWAYGAAFIAALLATFSWIAPLGFQFFTSYLIAFLATLVLYWLLQSPPRQVWIAPLFVTIGVLTAFFDFLTTPLLTFLLPLALYLLWRAKTALNAKHAGDVATLEKGGAKTAGNSLLKTVVLAASWLLGYAGFWASKWLLTAVTYSAEYANAEFSAALALRGGTQGGGVEYRFAALYNNLYQLVSLRPDGSIFMSDFFLRLFLVLAVTGLVWWLLVKLTKTEMTQVKQALPLLLVVAGPYVWYFVVAGHSTFHSWFTYRLQTASVLGLLFFVLLSIDWAGLAPPNYAQAARKRSLKP